ncbi:MAG: Fur family transcriptional regulator [Ilumatobacteraceae bacterium]
MNPALLRVERVMATIQRSGGRITVPTVIVASVLATSGDHLTADQVIAESARRQPGIAASTVYRVLQRLADLGLVEQIRSAAGATFYHLLETPHTHLICAGCGAVSDLRQGSEAALRSLSAHILREHDFELEAHHHALLGRCRACATSSHQRRHASIEPLGDELTGNPSDPPSA